MPLFGRRDGGSAKRDDPAYSTLLGQLERLSEEQARRVEQAAADIGLGASKTSADTIAIMLSSSVAAGRDKARSQGQEDGHKAIDRSPGAKGRFPRAHYAAGVLAESFVIRDLLDERTWSYLTRPWHDVLGVPAHGEEGVGVSDETGREIRAFIEQRAREMDAAVSPTDLPVPPWLAELRDPAKDDRLIHALSESGMSTKDSQRLLSVIRREVEKRSRTSRPMAELSLRKLVDIAGECKEQAPEAWDLVVADLLDAGDEAAATLDRLMSSPYAEARSSLWAYLYPKPFAVPPGSPTSPIEEEVLPGLHARLAIHSGASRWRPVFPEMIATWGVEADVAWADAIENIANAPVQATPWPDPDSPVRIVGTPDMEAEWLGLLVHRLPGACPIGHLVAMPFRNAALVLPLDALPDVRGVPAFATLAAEAYRKASEFDDELYPQLLWVDPSGTPTVLFDINSLPGSPADLPASFLTALASRHQPGGAA